MSNPYIKYPLVLAVVTALSGLLLYATFSGTAASRKAQDELAKTRSLEKIFFNGYGKVVAETANGVDYMKVWKGDAEDGEPDFYAVTGSGIGYNAASPIVLMVGFANPNKELPEKSGKNGAVIMGWSVIASEETPGLGENAKNEAAAFTIAEKITGQAKEPGADRRTGFQKQFYNPEEGKLFTATDLKLKKNGGDIDIITGATYTTNGIVEALKDADTKLQKIISL